MLVNVTDIASLQVFTSGTKTFWRGRVNLGLFQVRTYEGKLTYDVSWKSRAVHSGGRGGGAVAPARETIFFSNIVFD